MSTFHAFVDRVAGGGAKLEGVDDRSIDFTLPASALPDDVGEGDVVEVELTNDPEKRKEHSEEVRSLEQDLIETPDDE